MSMLPEDRFFRAVKWAVAAAFVIVPIIALTGFMPGYSEGERAGIVTKVSRKGVIWKTWECEMNLGGMLNKGDDGGMVSNIWSFTVQDDEVLKKVQELQRSGKRATLRYTQWFLPPMPQTSSGYMVEEVVEGR